MSDRPTILLEHHLRELRLPTFLREYGKMAAHAPPRGWTTRTICSGCLNWSS